MEKHTTAMVFLRRTMLLAEKKFASVPELLTDFNSTLEKQIWEILDDLLKRDRL